ncbi:Hsp90-like protein [Phytophthora cinnamomi]|uniref:Hsp90-like protein n=1 Tax=Phytophthora cinnamomi TaxID=4785 RepID=UPI003559BA06|nr:Hsp90-like protein [Phytophthora cinnamomi]
MFGGDAALPFSRHSDVLHGPVPTDPTELENLVAELKRRGNAAFQQKALEEAEVLYSRAITVNESDPLRNQHIFFANRSAARCSMGKAALALEDAEACVALDATYAKGFFRQAQALVKLGRFKEALVVLESAKALEPSNKSVTTLYAKVQEMAKKEKEAPAAPAPKKVVTRVEVAQSSSSTSSSSTKTPAAAPAAAASSTVVDDDAEIVGHVRGYKKLADGRVTTFFNNELTEEAKQLIGDIAPKKVEDPNKVQIKSVDGGSAWNQGNTFEEKDMTSWAKAKLEKIVSGVSAPLGTGEGVVTSLEVSDLEGDASIAVVRGAKRYIFDFTFTLACTLKQGENSVTGELKFLDLSSDCGGDYDVEAVVPSRYQSESGKALRAALNSSSSPFRKELTAQLATFVEEYHTF